MEYRVSMDAMVTIGTRKMMAPNPTSRLYSSRIPRMNSFAVLRRLMPKATTPETK
jgi:hypothetical protein